MPPISSSMLPLGTIAPSFTLPDSISGRTLSLDELKGNRGTLVMFICNHCPFVIHVNAGLVRLAGDYAPHGISTIAISSNDIIRYPQDSPERMREVAAANCYPFPYLYDESQDVARAFRAACTPDFFLFDSDMRLVYRGQMDDSRPSNGKPVTGSDLRGAIDAVVTGSPVSELQVPSIGCGIKWKTN